MDSDTRIYTFLAGYAYNVYFSIIVLKIGLKLIRIIRHNIDYELTRKIITVVFCVYEGLLIGALGFSIVEREHTCFGTIWSL